MVVDFFIAGVQKAGTTALYRLLVDEPKIEMSSQKEPHFFDDDSLDWARPNYDRYHAAFIDRTGAIIRGEATPIYMFWPNSLERIRAYNAAAKFIVLLRHPAFRAHSHWRKETRRGRETIAFADAIGPAGERRAACGTPEQRRIYSFLERGFYAPQVLRLHALFPADRTLFLRTDEFWNETMTTVRRVCHFLDVEMRRDLRSREYIVAHDTRGVGSLSKADQARLTDLYRQDILATQRLTGLHLEDWLDRSYTEPMG